MTIFVEYEDGRDRYAIYSTDNPGQAMEYRNTRREAVSAARKYAAPGEEIAVKGPRSTGFTPVS